MPDSIQRTHFQDFEIIAANGVDEKGFNLYTPEYGQMFLGNFPSVPAAAREAVRLGGYVLSSVTVL